MNLDDLVGSLVLEEIYIEQAFDYYRLCYQENEWCEHFVRTSGRIPDELRNRQFIGLCDRSIGTIVPVARTLEGGAIRGGLQHVGLITATGGELFRGCMVFPTFDDSGKIVAAVGYRFGKRIRHWQPESVSWKKPEPGDYLLEGMAIAKEVVHAKAFH